MPIFVAEEIGCWVTLLPLQKQWRGLQEGAAVAIGLKPFTVPAILPHRFVVALSFCSGGQLPLKKACHSMLLQNLNLRWN